jgi:hypothetical protein
MSTAMMNRPTSPGSVSEEEPWIELDPWLEAEDILTADSLVCVARPAPSPAEFIELEPATVFESQLDMRLGDRTYTPAQARVIELAVRRRRPLNAPPIPSDD